MSEDYLSNSNNQITLDQDSSEQHPEGTNDRKERHGCLASYLGFMLFVSAITLLMGISGFILERPQGWEATDYELVNRLWDYILLVLPIMNIIFIIALFRWRKWGFWGFLITNIVYFIINLMIGTNLIVSLWGLAGLLALYYVLQIGDQNKGWPQLQ